MEKKNIFIVVCGYSNPEVRWSVHKKYAGLKSYGNNKVQTALKSVYTEGGTFRVTINVVFNILYNILTSKTIYIWNSKSDVVKVPAVIKINTFYIFG